MPARGSKHHNYKGGYWIQKTGLYRKGNASYLHKKACANYRNWFLDAFGYLFCEVCKVNSSLQFSTHHIYFASRFPRHPELHNPKNLILVCIDCHADFHSGKLNDIFLQLERKRGLKKLFGVNVK